MLKPIRLIAIILYASCIYGQNAELTQLLNNGPVGSKINIVFLSEGYTQNELPKFINDAKTKLNYLVTSKPFNMFSNSYNAFAISVASAESGSDHPMTGIYKDTYFNSTFYSYGTERLLTIAPNNLDTNYTDGVGKVIDLLATFVPNYHIVIILVNDLEYGASGGTIAVTSLNYSSNEVILHELGHTIGGLADEYTTENPGWVNSEYPNVTQETDRSLIKWKKFILDSTPIPTPVPTASLLTYAHAIGLYEGAEYQKKGWYRPKYYCKMRTLNTAFCEVCIENIVNNLISLGGVVSKIEETSSLPSEFKLSQNYPNPFNPTTQIDFSILRSGSYNLKVFDLLGREIETLVNNEQLSAGKYVVSFNAKNLPSGIYIYRLTGNNVNMSQKMLLVK